jgi:DNA repair exonuclease SbcCD ATPase subunit
MVIVYMRKFLVLATFLFLFFPLVSSVSAQTSTPTITPKGQQVRQEVKQKITEQRTEKTATLAAQRQAKIKAFFARMMNRFEAAIERLEKLIERIQTRIDKIKEEDPSVDLSDQEEQLDDAQGSLTGAINKIQELKDDFDTLLTSDEPGVIFKEIGEDVRDLKQDLVEVHRILVHIIGDIKGLRVGQGTPKPTATPTATP